MWQCLKKLIVELSYDLTVPKAQIQETEHICSHKNLCSNVYSSSIGKSPKAETTQIFSISLIKKCILYIPTMEYNSSAKEMMYWHYVLW